MDAAFPSITAPRLVVSGLSGGGGKTLLSLGLARALTLRGLRVKPCKKGPDYIDAAWLGLASGRTPTNLDPFFLTDARLRLPLLEATGACTTGATCRGAAPPRPSPALLARPSCLPSRSPR